MFDYYHEPEIWVQILGLASFIALTMSTPLYDKILRYLKLVYKPFTCPKCMAFWCSAIYFQYQFVDPMYTIFLAAITGAAAAIIDTQINPFSHGA